MVVHSRTDSRRHHLGALGQHPSQLPHEFLQGKWLLDHANPLLADPSDKHIGGWLAGDDHDAPAVDQVFCLCSSDQFDAIHPWKRQIGYK